MTMKRLIEKNIIIYYGLLSSVICFLIGAIPAVTIDGTMLLFSLYLPGIIFGGFLASGLSRTNLEERVSPFFLVLLSIFIYIGFLYFINKDISFNLALRRVSASGLAALLLLSAVQMIYKIKFSILDFVLVFSVGVLSTFFSWEDNYEIFNPWLIYLSIAIWQIFIAYIIQKRIQMITNSTTTPN
jgi:hypothetical protein